MIQKYRVCNDLVSFVQREDSKGELEFTNSHPIENMRISQEEGREKWSVDYIAQTRVLPWSLRCNLTEKKNKLLENFWGGPPAALTVSQNKIPQQDYNFILAHIFTRIISTLIFKGPLATKTSLQANKEPALSSMVNVLVLIRNLCIVFTCYVSWVDSSLEYQ